MAGYSKIYCVGGLGGFRGADGINPIVLQILVGDADRQWLEAHYLNPSIRPLGSLRITIPKRPNDPNALIDACIAFLPQHFANCPSFKSVARKLKNSERLDFDRGENVPVEWPALRSEALDAFRQLHILEADLRLLDLTKWIIHE